MFDSFKSKLGESREALNFPTLDSEQFIDDEGVKAAAAEMGADNLPASDELELDTNQQGYVAHFRRLLQRANLDVDQCLRAEDQCQAECLDRADPSRFEESVTVTAHRFVELSHSLKDRMVEARHFERRARLDLRRFRTENDLCRREAIYPDSAMPVAFLVMLVLVEGIANSQFFYSSSVQGWLGAVTLAFIVSAANVLISVLAGIQLRGWNHISAVRQTVAIVGLGFYLVVIVAFHYVLAGYRVRLGLWEDQAAAAALSNILSEPFAGWDVYAALMFVVGLLFAAMALVKGYRGLDDVYPGYGAISRRYQAARENYLAMRGEYFQSISRIRDDQLGSAEDIRADGRVAMAEFRESAARSARYTGLYNAALRTLAESVNVVLARYQSVNTQVRDTVPPAYFADSFVFDESDRVRLPDLDAAREIIEDFPRRRAVLETSAKQANAAIWEASTEATRCVQAYFSEVENEELNRDHSDPSSAEPLRLVSGGEV